MPGREVRRASAGDAAAIAAAHVRSWQSAYRGLLPQDYLDRLDPADRAGRWRRILRDLDWSRGGVLVIAAGTEILGFAGFGPSRDEDQAPGVVGEIESIYLLPRAWGQSVGQRLMDAALDHLAGAGYVLATLWVLDSNARARRFYAKGGWAEDGAVKHDDSRGFPITELRYRRRLP